MKKLLASLRTMLLLPLLALGVAPASAQTSLEPVPALADIKSQEELAKAVAGGKEFVTQAIRHSVALGGGIGPVDAAWPATSGWD